MAASPQQFHLVSHSNYKDNTLNVDAHFRKGFSEHIGHAYSPIVGAESREMGVVIKSPHNQNAKLLNVAPTTDEEGPASDSPMNPNIITTDGTPLTKTTFVSGVLSKVFRRPHSKPSQRSISVSTVAVLAVLVAVLMSSGLTAAIIITFSLKGAREIAESSSTIVTAGCRQRLSDAINYVSQCADVTQFSISWDLHPLPLDDTQVDFLGAWRAKSVRQNTMGKDLVVPTTTSSAKSMEAMANEAESSMIDAPTAEMPTPSTIFDSSNSSPSISTPIAHTAVKKDKSVVRIIEINTTSPATFTNTATSTSTELPTLVSRQAAAASPIAVGGKPSVEPAGYPTGGDSGEGWYLKWHKLCMMTGRGTTFSLLSQMSMAFHDGSYVGCVSDKYNSSQIKCVHARVNPVGNAFWYHNITYYHAITGMPVGNMTVEIGSVDTRQRAWYKQIMDNPASRNGTIPYDKAWGAFTAAPNKYRASVALSFTMVNRTGTPIGIGTYNVGLDVFSEYIASVKPSENAKVVLLDDFNRVVATSMDIIPFKMRIVTFFYVLTAVEVAAGCVISDYHSSSSLALDRKELYCPITIGDTGYRPLMELQDKYSSFLDSPTQCIGRHKLDGEPLWVSIAHVTADTSAKVKWKVVIFVPERDVTDFVKSGTIISVMVCIVLVVGVMFTFGLSLRWLLRPLAAIAVKMSTAAFLDNDSVSDSISSQTESTEGSVITNRGSDHDCKPAKKSSKSETPKLLSYLSDVAAIQKAYWEMADELRILRGYIPEHICNELIDKGRAPPLAAPCSPVQSDKAVSAGATIGSPESKLSGFTTIASITHPTSELTNGHTIISSREGHYLGAVAEGVETGTECNRSAYNEAMGLPPAACDSVLLSSNEAAKQESLSGITADAARRGRSDSYHRQTQPVFFRDNVLIDRDISVAVVNIVGFHAYAQVTHGADLTKHHEALVAYIHLAASKCGGVLETFSGDKFWVSFNATTKCDLSAVAAACFGLEVATIVNKEAASAREALTLEHEMRVNNQPIKSRYHPKFRAALRGVTVGVATGRAFVGPLGTSTIRRHSIISNAMTEAAVLERQSSHYPDCGVMVAGDMIPAIEGYMQYFILDACVLPGSGGLRRRLASLKGAMCAPGCNPSCLRGLSDLATAIKVTQNPYLTTNNFFNSFLEGRNEECVALMQELDTSIRLSKGMPPQEGCVAAAVEANRGPIPQAVADAMLLRLQLAPQHAPPSVPLTPKECENVAIMLRFVWSLMFANPPIDGRRYKSPLGQMNAPTGVAVL